MFLRKKNFFLLFASDMLTFLVYIFHFITFLSEFSRAWKASVCIRKVDVRECWMYSSYDEFIHVYCGGNWKWKKKKGNVFS